MNFCSNCGASVQATNFCSACGASLTGAKPDRKLHDNRIKQRWLLLSCTIAGALLAGAYVSYKPSNEELKASEPIKIQASPEDSKVQSSAAKDLLPSEVTPPKHKTKVVEAKANLKPSQKIRPTFSSETDVIVKLCNKTDSATNAAIVVEKTADTFMTTGWFHLPSGYCERIQQSSKKRLFGVFAYNSDYFYDNTETPAAIGCVKEVPRDAYRPDRSPDFFIEHANGSVNGPCEYLAHFAFWPEGKQMDIDLSFGKWRHVKRPDPRKTKTSARAATEADGQKIFEQCYSKTAAGANFPDCMVDGCSAIVGNEQNLHSECQSAVWRAWNREKTKPTKYDNGAGWPQ